MRSFWKGSRSGARSETLVQVLLKGVQIAYGAVRRSDESVEERRLSGDSEVSLARSHHGTRLQRCAIVPK
jgi:hypothetical protein